MNQTQLKNKLYEIIFESDTPNGKLFDVILLIAILISVSIAMLETVSSIATQHQETFYILEWVFTIIFTIEFFTRIYCIKKKGHYIFSFFGIVDLLSILPTYLSLFIPGSQSLLIVRSIRLLRMFRILKLTRYLGESQVLLDAMRASQIKITVFLGAVLVTVCIGGTLMYLIEGPRNGFDNIPQSIYWLVVTITTVGYGDVVPVTALGKFFASLFMISGYGIIAVPTGIVSVELSKAGEHKNSKCCIDNEPESNYCKHCGNSLAQIKKSTPATP